MTQDQAETTNPSGVRSRLFSGLRWTGGSQVIQQVLNLGFSVVMARLLLPEDFGLLAMASVFTGVVFLVLDLGLSSALIQRQDIQQQQISSIFWMNVLTGFLMMLTGFALSGAIAAFYQNPAVQPVVMGLSINFLIFSFSSTQQALLSRQMNFQSLELRTIGGHLVGTACGIGLAFAGFGVWSLVARIVITGLVGMALLWTVSNWRPSFHFRWADVKQLMGFGNDVLATNFLEYVGRNADNLLIGRFLGATDLGYYALAYNLMRLPVQRFAHVLVNVLFPALSRLQDDLDKLKRGWLRSVRLTSAVTIPMMLGLIALAPQLVRVVYGDRWIPVIPILQVLAVVGIVQALMTLNNPPLLALGYTRLRLKLTSLILTLAIASFAVGLPFGILGVATSYTLVYTAASAFALWKTVQCVQLSLLEYFQNLAGVTIAAGIMAGAVLAIGLWVPLSPPLIVAIAIPLGIVTYLLGLRLFAPAVVQEALSVLSNRFTRRWLKQS